MQHTLEVHLTRADMDAEWERNNPGPLEPFKQQNGCRPCSVIAREKASVGPEWTLDRVEPLAEGMGGYKVHFKPTPPPAPPEPVVDPYELLY